MKGKGFGIDQVQRLVQRPVVNAAATEKPQDPLPFAGFLLEARREIVQVLLPGVGARRPAWKRAPSAAPGLL